MTCFSPSINSNEYLGFLVNQHVFFRNQMSKYFLKLALMNRRGEGKSLLLHELIRKQDVRTCCGNLKRNTYTDVQTRSVYSGGFHAGRSFKSKKLSLSRSVFGLHENLICSMSWIQKG